MLEHDEIDAGAAEHVHARVDLGVARAIEDDHDAIRAGRDVAGQARGAAAERRAGAAHRHDHVDHAPRSGAPMAARRVVTNSV